MALAHHSHIAHRAAQALWCSHRAGGSGYRRPSSSTLHTRILFFFFVSLTYYFILQLKVNENSFAILLRSALVRIQNFWKGESTPVGTETIA
jgi:hypothetical protein